MAKKKKREVNQEKQPHIAWRIGRVVLDVLGRIVLFLLGVAAERSVLVCAVAGSIFNEAQGLSEIRRYPRGGSHRRILWSWTT